MSAKTLRVYGFGAFGIHMTYEALLAGIPTEVLTSPSKPTAGYHSLAILERHGELFSEVIEGVTRTFESRELEDEAFQFAEAYIAQGMPWIRRMPIEYHRMTSYTPDQHPYSGMEMHPLSSAELQRPYSCGYRFNGFVLNPGAYLDYLTEQIMAHPLFCGLEYGEIKSPNDVDHPNAVIACGMGQGLWDPLIYPGLGEGLVVRSPSTPRDKVIGGISPERSSNLLPVPGSIDWFRVGMSKRDGLDNLSPRQPWWEFILREAIRMNPTLADAQVLMRFAEARPKHKGGPHVHITTGPDGELVIVGGLAGGGMTFSRPLARRLARRFSKRFPRM